MSIFPRPARLFVAAGFSASALFASSYVVPPDDVLIGKAEAIVVARATANWVEDTTERGIETVTEFRVEDTLKGDVPHTFRIRMPGGHFGKAFKIVPGVPRFAAGEQVLLFLNHPEGTDHYVTTDLALGRFAFRDDNEFGRLAVRTEEIFGWDLKTNQRHREIRRSAQKFIDYIRAIANGRPAEPGYVLPDRRPLGPQPNALHPATQSCTFGVDCTVTQYTLSFYTVGNPPCNTGNATNDANCAENGQGGRWNVFPSQVNFNRGNAETMAPNNGNDAMDAAFTAWDGDLLSNVNYARVSATPNTNGIQEAPDGVNNIVFEKNLGYGTFSCAGGGVLGLGGINSASGTNMVGSETFFSTIEGDVSMNIGVNACIGQTPGIPVGDFNSAVTHEVGHTLGFRHADQDRRVDAPTACTGFSTYECASSAIMTAFVTQGINATLQTWDQHAVRSVYPSAAPPAAVTAVEAHATTATNVQVTWSGSCSTTCHIYRSADKTIYTLLNPVTTVTSPPYADTTATTKTSYLYKVRAFNGSESADSNIDMATTVIYTNTIVAGSSIVQPVDLNEMRDAVDAVRTLDGIGAGAYSWGSGSPTRVTSGTLIHAADINEMRTNLNTAYNGIFGSTPTYTNTITAGATLVQAIDFNEIRNLMR